MDRRSRLLEQLVVTPGEAAGRVTVDLTGNQWLICGAGPAVVVVSEVWNSFARRRHV